MVERESSPKAERHAATAERLMTDAVSQTERGEDRWKESSPKAEPPCGDGRAPDDDAGTGLSEAKDRWRRNRARRPSRHAATAERLMTDAGTGLSEAKDGAGGGNRTHTTLRSPDFESD